MYTLTRSLTVRALLVEQVPALLISLVIATLFYHFGNFLPEVVAFLATWWVVDWAYQQLLLALGAKKPAAG
ncbi:MAG: hypothetical protein ACRC1H_00965 [Caldilineaceae bacterium]